MNIQNSIPKILSRAIGAKFFFILSIGASICLTSCDESSVVGLDVQPENDLLNVGYQDTTTILTRTVKGDSLITDETLITTGVALIGKYIDPVFGTSTGSIYTQVRLPSNIASTTFGTLPICDSIILALVYDGAVYGKKDRKNQKLNVYQVTESMSTTPIYYSNRTFTKNTVDLTAANGYVFKPRPLDSVTTVGGLRLKPQLRVLLDNSLGQIFLNNQTTGEIATNAAFQDFFRGIYITTENTTGLASEEGNIIHFKMGESKITLYYHNSNATNNDSLKYDFGLGSVARVNHFEHDYTGAIADLSGQLASTAPFNQTVYVQSMAGTRTKVEFPHLMRWVDNGLIGVNKAELVVSVDTSVATYKLDTFAAPLALMLFGINDDGSTYPIPDAFEGSNYFGGTYTSTTVQYRFNIARYIQQVMDGDRKNNGLYLIASNGAIYGNRVVIGGAASTTRPMKLNITYTKLH
ncbi:hypothetical protein BH10BAC1_BH10BAC1_00820 [soil metagenome]